VGLSREEFGRSWRPWLRGAAIGFPLGSLPAGGAEIPTFLSYNVEKRLSKHPEEFGKGAIEGVAGPEAANNAAFSGVLVPLLTLGIPTSATAAILLAAFQIYNLQPGPLLFQNSPDLVWALIASLYIGNVMLLLLNLPLIRLWVKILEIPRPLLYTGILVFATLGVYASSNSLLDVLVMYAIGVVGFFMRRYDFPVGPVVLGVILGPQLEAQFRRAMSISQGDPSVFLTRPISLLFLLAAAFALALPYVIPRLRAARGAKGKRVVFGDASED
jgi:putative tricarboxylic transport membrane protein